MCMGIWDYKKLSYVVYKYKEKHLKMIKCKKIHYTCNLNLALCCTIFAYTIDSVRSPIYLVDG